MEVVTQIHIKMRGAESSKQAGGCLLIQESLCCMELKSTMPCAQERSTRAYIKFNQVRGQLLHSLTIHFGQGPCFVRRVSSVTSGAIWPCVWADLWMDHFNTISQKTGSTKWYLWDKLRTLLSAHLCLRLPNIVPTVFPTILHSSASTSPGLSDAAQFN